MSYKNNQFGQGLMEVIVAIFIIATGISGAVTLTYSNLRNNQTSINQIIAANLAREGVEVVRNLRDENWLNEREWLNGIKPLKPIFENPGVLVFSTTTNIWSIRFTSGFGMDRRLFLDSDGIYNTEARGILTPYLRTIEIYDNLCQQEGKENQPPAFQSDCPAGWTTAGINVKSEVQWQDRGNTKVYIIEENLYNWHDVNEL